MCHADRNYKTNRKLIVAQLTDVLSATVTKWNVTDCGRPTSVLPHTYSPGSVLAAEVPPNVATHPAISDACLDHTVCFLCAQKVKNSSN